MSRNFPKSLSYAGGPAEVTELVRQMKEEQEKFQVLDLTVKQEIKRLKEFYSVPKNRIQVLTEIELEKMGVEVTSSNATNIMEDSRGVFEFGIGPSVIPDKPNEAKVIMGSTKTEVDALLKDWSRGRVIALGQAGQFTTTPKTSQ